jgi:hypothetical protein
MDRENPLHRKKYFKFTAKIPDLWVWGAGPDEEPIWKFSTSDLRLVLTCLSSEILPKFIQTSRPLPVGVMLYLAEKWWAGSQNGTIVQNV